MIDLNHKQAVILHEHIHESTKELAELTVELSVKSSENQARIMSNVARLIEVEDRLSPEAVLNHAIANSDLSNIDIVFDIAAKHM